MSPAKATSPAKKKHARRAAPPEDMATSLRSIVHDGVAAMRDEMALLTGKKPIKAGTLDRIVDLTDKASTIMGRVRLSDAAVTAAARKLSGPAVVEFLRGLTVDDRAQLVAEANGHEPAGSVFGR